MMIVVLNDLIAFPKKFLRAYQVPAGHVELSSLMTDYGLLIPCGADSWNMLDELDGYLNGSAFTSMCVCWIMDKAGVIRELYSGSGGKVRQRVMRRLPIGPGTFIVRSEDVDIERAAQVAYALHPNDLPKILAAIELTFPVPEDSWHIVPIKTLQNTVGKSRRKFKPLHFT